MQFFALALVLLPAVLSVSGASIIQRGGGVPPPPPLCGRSDWLDIYYGDITSSGVAELGFKVTTGLVAGQEYHLQLLNIPVCLAQEEIGAIPEKDFTMKVILSSRDGTSVTISPKEAHATDLVFVVPKNDTVLGEVAITFTTKTKPSAVNDLFNTYGPVLNAV